VFQLDDLIQDDINLDQIIQLRPAAVAAYSSKTSRILAGIVKYPICKDRKSPHYGIRKYRVWAFDITSDVSPKFDSISV